MAYHPHSKTYDNNHSIDLMSYQVLARKWRPHNFTQVVGQEHIVKALSNALEHQRMHHAYLFTGTRGVGKTTIARILAKALNCESRQDFNPCCACSVCLAVDEGSFMDLLEVDAASRTKVEDTRDLLDNVQYAPSQGQYKVYLIDEVHMLSGHSFNALLKTLEEPPAHVKFLLATTDPQKIPVTVLSRCLQFNLKRLTVEQIATQMSWILEQEKITFETAALRVLARAADGSMRDGLSLLDQAIVHGSGQVTESEVNDMLGCIAQQPVLDLLDALASGQAEAVFDKISQLAELSPDFGNVLQQLLLVLHRIALLQAVPKLIQTEEQMERLERLVKAISPEDVQLFYQIGLIGQRDLPLAPDTRSGFEMVMLRMLAFKPVTANAATADTPPVLTRKPPALMTPAPLSTNQFAIREPEPTAMKPTAVVEDEQTKTQQSQPAENDWLGIVKAMGVTAMVRELANNCLLQQVDESSCTLVLAPKYEQLSKGVTPEKLEKALQTYYQRPLKLNLKLAETEQQQATPAVQLEQQRQDRQKQAEVAIEQDETVQALKDTFDARIVAGTTKPLD